MKEETGLVDCRVCKGAERGGGEVGEVVVEGAAVEEVAVADALAEEGGVGGGGGEVVTGHAVKDDEGFMEARGVG
ncbi:hypothetical protein QJS10_CPA08g00053 [Acorus calamus]|uniref:Uncharacterized protein n=1 Tax=Acorus calamus TaxID=4465 RepID=A0AAV9EHE4_ACOCL|nr:hypothetical protein QJS10_CPA08g00053 [Acorus calamus]